MISISWNAEGGSDGTATSTGNSGGASGTAWDTCQRGTNATNEYDSAQKSSGSLSVLLATGATSTTAYNRWNGALTALWASGLTTHYGRFSFRLAAIPGTNRILVEFLDTGAATNRANFLMLTTGALRLRNAANGTVATFTTICSVDTWYRVEYRIDGSTSGAYEMHLYAGTSTTALEDIVGGTANFGGTVGCVNYGYVSNAASLASLWFDSIQINDTGLPGPEATTHTVAVGQATETDTANALARLKTKALGQTAETDTANALGRLKVQAVGQAAESDSAAALSRLKVRAVGQIAETDTANPLGRQKTTALGQAAETEAAQPLGRVKTLALGRAVETDTVAAISRPQVAAIGQAAEVDTAQPITIAGPARDLTFTAGPPLVDWRAGWPRIGWGAGEPLTSWHAGTPTT